MPVNVTTNFLYTAPPQGSNRGYGLKRLNVSNMGKNIFTGEFMDTDLKEGTPNSDKYRQFSVLEKKIASLTQPEALVNIAYADVDRDALELGPLYIEPDTRWENLMKPLSQRYGYANFVESDGKSGGYIGNYRFRDHERDFIRSESADLLNGVVGFSDIKQIPLDMLSEELEPYGLDNLETPYVNFASNGIDGYLGYGELSSGLKDMNDSLNPIDDLELTAWHNNSGELYPFGSLDLGFDDEIFDIHDAEKFIASLLGVDTDSETITDFNMRQMLNIMKGGDVPVDSAMATGFLKSIINKLPLVATVAPPHSPHP